MSYTIVAFGASSSKKSINKAFASFAASQIEDAEVIVLDLNDFEMPIYSIDRELEDGIPEEAHLFRKHLHAADGIVISFAEHNGAYSAAFKNVFDWASRVGKDVWGNNPMLLLSTSPGGRGGQTVLEIAVNKFKFMNSNEIVSFSLPSFGSNFKVDTITNEELRIQFEAKLESFVKALSTEKIEK